MPLPTDPNRRIQIIDNWKKKMEERNWGRGRIVSTETKKKQSEAAKKRVVKEKEFTCIYCNNLFLSKVHNPSICYSCKEEVEVSCQCGCNTLTKIKVWKANSGITPYKRGHHKNSRNNSGSQNSKVEILIGSYLRGWESHYPVDPYIVDFALPSEMKILEVYGCYWHGCSCTWKSLRKEDKEKVELIRKADSQRVNFLKSKGWEVEILWEHNVSFWVSKKLFHSSMTTVTRYHDICAGHRVYGHESKCAHLHGHNYRIHFTCASASLDSIGRVIDFSVIKKLLCIWLEDKWDHRFLIWVKDPIARKLKKIDKTVVIVPFNPTAENIARYLVEILGPKQLIGTGVHLISCKVEETRKCCSEFRLSDSTIFNLEYSKDLLLAPQHMKYNKLRRTKEEILEGKTTV